METCYRHPTRETGVSCSSCDRPICPDCMTATPVGMRCPECARQRTKVIGAGRLQGELTLTYGLIAVNVVVWLAEVATGGGSRGGGELFEKGALFGPSIADQQEYWRLVTSGFLHVNDLPFGLLHVGFNMYLLYFLGGLLEPSLGRLRFLAVYFTALLSGSFGALLLTPTSLTVGASGAVFGLMGAAVIVMRARGIDPWQSGIGPLILINLLLTFSLSGISIGGHLGGLAGGAAAAFVLTEVYQRQRLIGSAGCAAIAVVAVLGGVAVAGGQGAL